MRKLRIGVIDLVTKGATHAIWTRVMYANLAGIMPQAVAAWCQEEGHEVSYLCYAGFENLVDELPRTIDLVFIGAFTEAAQLAYALSSEFRSRGTVTVLGGSHARCYPQDAQKYFDYVLGLTDKSIVHQVLTDCAPNRPTGIYLSAARQPSSIPGVRQRWAFIEPTMRKAPFIKLVPMLGSLGCPYECSFCIDSVVPYQPLDKGGMKEDLAFLLKKFERPRVAFHDPNFGVRFDDDMNTIEEAVPPGRIEFVAESSLSLLSEAHLRRLERNGFVALLPGIESWFELEDKSQTGKLRGMDKVREVSEHVNMILRYIPYLQTNFVLGLDVDQGSEPFELTKRFIDMTPGAFPGYSLLTAFGQAAPLNLRFQEADRVIPFPFHFLNTSAAMNVQPKNYSWPEFYEHVIDLTRYSFSPRAIVKRTRATRGFIPKWLNVVRALSPQEHGRRRIYYDSEILCRLHGDPQFRSFFERQTTNIPQFYIDRVHKDLGPLWNRLPEGALQHDPNAYLKSIVKDATKTAETLSDVQNPGVAD